ncbi:MAG: zf-HC2 domain-containing protein [Planctomycetes bacterium]|nr:zf-HC2 domain-containing protein [Planctomycetota bacterium]
MKQIECKEIADLLVDYSDGQLPEEQSQIVERHLKKCNNCRKYLGDLQQSLNIVQEIWRENLAEIESVEISVPVKNRRNINRKYAAIAAGLLIAAGIFSVSMQQTLQRPGDVMTAEQVERKISESASAVRLLATADLLREYDGVKDTLNKLYKHIVATYPDTSAAMEAKIRIKSLM